MDSYIEISSEDSIQPIHPQPPSNSLSDENKSLNYDSSELDLPSFSEFGSTKTNILFTNKKTNIHAETEVVDLTSPSKSFIPQDSNYELEQCSPNIQTLSTSVTSHFHFSDISSLHSSPPLNQNEFDNPSDTVQDKLVSNITTPDNFDNSFDLSNNLTEIFYSELQQNPISHYNISTNETNHQKVTRYNSENDLDEFSQNSKNLPSNEVDHVIINDSDDSDSIQYPTTDHDVVNLSDEFETWLNSTIEHSKLDILPNDSFTSISFDCSVSLPHFDPLICSNNSINEICQDTESKSMDYLLINNDDQYTPQNSFRYDDFNISPLKDLSFSVNNTLSFQDCNPPLALSNSITPSNHTKQNQQLNLNHTNQGIAKLNRAKPSIEDACKQLLVKHSSHWIRNDNELGKNVIDSIKSLDIDVIPCDKSEVPWCLEYFIIKNFQLNQEDGILYPLHPEQYKITEMNKILLKWNTEEIIRNLEISDWSLSNATALKSHPCQFELFLDSLHPKSITIIILNYHETIKSIHKQSKKAFEQQLTSLSQNQSNNLTSSQTTNRTNDNASTNKVYRLEQIQLLEDFLNYIQIKMCINLVFMENPVDIINYIKLFSSTVATIPFRTEPTHEGLKVNMEHLHFKKIIPSNDLNMIQNQFYKTLQQIPSITPSIAKTIVTTYHSPKDLITSYQTLFTDSEKQSLISDLKIANKGHSNLNSNKKIGSAISQKLLKLFSSVDGNDNIL